MPPLTPTLSPPWGEREPLGFDSLIGYNLSSRSTGKASIPWLLLYPLSPNGGEG
jgi:hypothetical protein